MEPRARCAGFSVAEIGNRKERLRVREAGASAAGRGQRDYASFPGFLPLNPLRTPSPPLKRAGTPCTRERGLRPGLTALRGASGGWVTGFEPVHITAFVGAKTLVENERGWFDHPFFSLPNVPNITSGCNASMSYNRNPTGSCNASMSCNRNTTSSCNASIGCNGNPTSGCNASHGCNRTQPAVAMHPRVAIGTQPAVAIPYFLQQKTKTS